MAKKGKQAQDLKVGDKTKNGRVVNVRDEDDRIFVRTDNGRGLRTQGYYGRTERT